MLLWPLYVIIITSTYLFYFDNFRKFTDLFFPIELKERSKLLSNENKKQKHTWSKESVPASSWVRLTKSITSKRVTQHSGLYKTSIVVSTSLIWTISSARFEFCERFTRASAAASETSWNNMPHHHQLQNNQ